LTAQGHPRAIFHRAIERGNLMVAETVLRELGRPSLVELLDLTALIATKDVGRHGRVAARWLLKYLEAKDDATIDDATLAAACLAALGGRRHVEALTMLRAMAEEASSRRLLRGVARTSGREVSAPRCSDRQPAP
jgi:hypothetical protein